VNKFNDRLDAARRQLPDPVSNASAPGEQAEPEVQALEAALEEMRKTAELNAARTARLTAERDAWMQELFESNRQAAHLVNVRQHLNEAMDRLKQENQRLQNIINALYASTSWKFARPVRAIAKVLRRR
jgi:chromosome segregation ATPase